MLTKNTMDCPLVQLRNYLQGVPASESQAYFSDCPHFKKDLMQKKLKHDRWRSLSYNYYVQFDEGENSSIGYNPRIFVDVILHYKPTGRFFVVKWDEPFNLCFLSFGSGYASNLKIEETHKDITDCERKKMLDSFKDL